MRHNNKDLVSYLIELLYPFIIVFGFYIILYGDISPGGGFQGGAIIASVFILRYIAQPLNELAIEHLQRFEKLCYILLIIIPFLSFGSRQIALTNFFNPATGYGRIYLILMNMLIGFKVCLGLTIIFYEFVLLERRWSK